MVLNNSQHQASLTPPWVQGSRGKAYYTVLHCTILYYILMLKGSFGVWWSIIQCKKQGLVFTKFAARSFVCDLRTRKQSQDLVKCEGRRSSQRMLSLCIIRWCHSRMLSEFILEWLRWSDCVILSCPPELQPESLSLLGHISLCVCKHTDTHTETHMHTYTWKQVMLSFDY